MLPKARLRLISGPAEPRTLIVLVSGIGAPSVETSLCGQKITWFNLVEEDIVPRPHVYVFDHGVGSSPEDESGIWPAVLSLHVQLLESLRELKSSEKYQSCPIVLIGHDIAGVIIKQLICEAFRAGETSRDVSSSVAEFVAISIPHLNSDKQSDWNQPQLLLGTRGLVRKPPSTAPGDACNLASISRRFEEVANNLPLLTICEIRETPIKGWIGKSHAYIVRPNSCQVRSRCEELLELGAHHRDICSTVPRARLDDFLEDKLGKARTRIDRERATGSPLAFRDLSSATDGTPSFSGRQEPDPTVAASTLPQPTLEPTQPPATANDSGVSHALQGQSAAPSTHKAAGWTLFDGKCVPEGNTPALQRRATDLANFSIEPSDPVLPCRTIPTVCSDNFTGREDDLLALEARLAPSAQIATNSPSLKSYAICAPGGMGKTQVATQYALTRSQLYDAVFWINAETQTSLSQDFGQIPIGLKLLPEAHRGAASEQAIFELARDWIANPVKSFNVEPKDGESVARKATWLLIFDNVVDPGILARFWPAPNTTGSILITSRAALAKTPLYRVNSGMDLEPLTLDQASDFLLRTTIHNQTAEEKHLSRKVADRLGCLPLALSQMVGIMNRQSVTFSEFMQRLDDERNHQELFRLSFESKQTYEHTLASVWALEKLGKSAALLDVLAYLDAAGVPEKILTDSLGTVHLDGFPQDENAYHAARSELFDSSLISKDYSQKKLVVHRMIQDTARAKMDLARSQAVFAATITILSKAWIPAGYGVRHTVSRWDACAPISLHIVRLKDHFSHAAEKNKVLLTKNLEFAELLNEVGWYFQELARSSEALEYFEIAHKMARQALDGTAPSSPDGEKATFLLAETHNNIAGSATEINDAPVALHHFERYNEILLNEHKGRDTTADARLTSSFFNIGLSYTMLGNYDRAVEFQLLALAEAKRISDPETAMGARSLPLTNLALTYWLMGNYPEALAHLECALKERRQRLGLNDRQSMITGRILHTLGNVEYSLGRSDRSLDYHEQALQHFKEMVGNSHHRTGNSCFKVAEHYARLGRTDEAIKLLDQALRVFSDRDCYRPERARVYMLKSKVLSERDGTSPESKRCFEEACSLYRLVNTMSEKQNEDLTLDEFSASIHVWGR